MAVLCLVLNSGALKTVIAQDALVDHVFSDPVEPASRIQLTATESGSPPALLPPPEPEEADLLQLRRELEEMKNRILQLEADQHVIPEPVTPKKKYPTFTITGFTQLDSALYDQSQNNKDTVGNAQNGTGFRRARLAVKGKVAEHTNYQVEMDFATAGHPSFFDTYVEQTNVPWLSDVKIGQFCQPFSIDALTGFRNLTFLERSLPFLAFVPFRRVGAQSTNLSEDEMTAFAISVYRTGGFQNAPLGDNRFGVDIGDEGGISISSRIHHLVQYDPNVGDRYLWAIGASYNYSVLGANTADGSSSPVPFYRTRVLPEFGPLGNSDMSQPFGDANNMTPSFIDSGRYRANYFNLIGLETVYQNGPVGITSEYMINVVDSPVGPIFYHGAYAQIAYRLTGEHRSYNKTLGTLGTLVPNTDFISFRHGGVKGWGAWEIAARWSFVDIRNPDDLNPYYLNGTSNVGNGILNDTTVGFTWFLNQHFKIQGNWIHCMLDNRVRGYSTADLLVSRVQVDF